MFQNFSLDILCWIVFNVSQKFVLPLILPGINAYCRKYAVCTSSNCFYMKINKVKAVFFRQLVNLCKKLLVWVLILILLLMRLKYMKKVKIFFSPHLEIEINNFWRHLKLSFSERFNIVVDGYVSKQKEVSHVSSQNSFVI